MNSKKVFIGATCLALNLSLAKIAAALSLPVYLDTIGTILSAALLPFPWAVGVAVSTSLLGGLVISPYFAAYAGTQLTIVLAAKMFLRFHYFTAWWRAILAGVGIAIIAVIVSAPVTVLLFGGITLSGTTAINALLIASGQSIWKSVIGGSIVIESLDKPTASFIAWLVLRRVPDYVKFQDLKGEDVSA